jgi:hypothetical protein
MSHRSPNHGLAEVVHRHLTRRGPLHCQQLAEITCATSRAVTNSLLSLLKTGRVQIIDRVGKPGHQIAVWEALDVPPPAPKPDKPKPLPLPKGVDEADIAWMQEAAERAAWRKQMVEKYL